MRHTSLFSFSLFQHFLLFPFFHRFPFLVSIATSLSVHSVKVSKRNVLGRSRHRRKKPSPTPSNLPRVNLLPR
ncbi:unnamed protein product [Nippostrongylus brasiliensis]|uniref:Secreted protein n=1 Tax=Nippostrongylus brasiliensis TaxID=27835 RepID=A0A0N4YQ54_NIPBR|nr:unnamed protein product [Nippostrongylus brasiliensis]